jgi:hypothetical protein
MHRQKHIRGTLTRGTSAKGLRGVHRSGMRGSIRHRSRTVRPHKRSR